MLHRTFSSGQLVALELKASQEPKYSIKGQMFERGYYFVSSREYVLAGELRVNRVYVNKYGDITAFG